jgi:hypothetical protein
MAHIMIKKIDELPIGAKEMVFGSIKGATISFAG